MTYTKNGHTYTSEDGKYQIIGESGSWDVQEVGGRFIGVAHTLKYAKQMVEESKTHAANDHVYWGSYS